MASIKGKSCYENAALLSVYTSKYVDPDSNLTGREVGVEYIQD